MENKYIMGYKSYKKGKHIKTKIGKDIKRVEKINKEKKMEEREKQSIQIMIDDKKVNGEYSNLASVMHNPEEFILDFLFMPPNNSKTKQAKLVSRIVLSPGHAKRIQLALNDNIAKYEARYGSINSPGKAEDKMYYN